MRPDLRVTIGEEGPRCRCSYSHPQTTPGSNLSTRHTQVRRLTLSVLGQGSPQDENCKISALDISYRSVRAGGRVCADLAARYLVSIESETRHPGWISDTQSAKFISVLFFFLALEFFLSHVVIDHHRR